MATKVDGKYSELISLSQSQLGWHKARIKFFVMFITALCKLQTVCFSQLAQGFEGKAEVGSNLRRIQRFFAGFAVDNIVIAKLIFSLLPHKPPYRLCLDRTNWKFGGVDINILMLSIAYEGVAIPLLWELLPKRGNSNCKERKRLLESYIGLFGPATIGSFLADREFIGDEWFGELISKEAPFYIRVRGNMWVDVPGGGRKKAFWLFNSLKLNQAYYCPKIVYLGKHLVYLSGVKTVGRGNALEFVIIASFKPGHGALGEYKHRWQIETMFRAMKSSGFNIEATHLSDLGRVTKLVALVAVAFTWAYKAGIYRHEKVKPIKVKRHGRRAYSFFKYGLEFIAQALLNPFKTKDLKICIKILSCT